MRSKPVQPAPRPEPAPALCEAWFDSAVQEALARLADGEGTPEDVNRVAAAAPENHRRAVPFVAQVGRILRVLREARARAAEQATHLVHEAATERNHRKAGDTALAACRMIARHGLLDEPSAPRLISTIVEPDCALDLVPDEVIVGHDVVETAPGKRMLLALAVDQKAVPPPAFDEADEERIANAVGDALLEEVG